MKKKSNPFYEVFISRLDDYLEAKRDCLPDLHEPINEASVFKMERAKELLNVSLDNYMENKINERILG